MAAKLDHLRVVTFESRMANEMSNLLGKRGMDTISAPSMQEVPFEKNRDAFSFAEKLLKGEIDIVIFLTGVGTRYLLETLKSKYPVEEILGALHKVFVVVRGPKPLKVLRDVKVPIGLAVPEPNTWRDILVALDESEAGMSVQNKVVAVQEYGKPNSGLEEGLRKRSARVIRVPVYRWALPDDTKPLQRAIEKIIAGEIEVATFTTATQIDHLFRMAKEMGVEEKLKSALSNIVIASIGPICSENLMSYGLSADIEPEHSKMGHLVLAISERAADILAQKRSCHPERSEGSGMTNRSGLTMTEQVPKELQNSPFMKACRREKTPYTPVWLMRQAGRYMKEYRDLRSRTPFIELCKNSDLATEITVTAQEKIKADAAIIFSDILLIVESFGLGLQYSKNEGPVIDDVIRSKTEIDRMPEIEPAESLGFVFDAIRKTRSALKPNIPLIGFSGAPFTLASYMIEGGSSKDFRHTKALMYSDHAAWQILMEKIARAVGKYLKLQIEAGAQAIQLFDSWVGCLGPEDYEKYVLPYSKMVIDILGTSVPVIHFGTNTGSLLELITKAGGDVIGVDFRTPIGDAWKRIGYDRAVQGNLDPALLLGPVQELEKRVKAILNDVNGRPGHIFNLGHGVLPETPVEHVIRLIELVHELTSSK